MSDDDSPGGLLHRYREQWAATAADREKMAAAGWSPSPGAYPGPVLVWHRADGWWSIEGGPPRDEDLCSYGIRPDRIDSDGKLLSWLSHLSEKSWFTREHMRQMLVLYEKLHPGRIPDA